MRAGKVQGSREGRGHGRIQAWEGCEVLSEERQEWPHLPQASPASCPDAAAHLGLLGVLCRVSPGG